MQFWKKVYFSLALLGALFLALTLLPA